MVELLRVLVKDVAVSLDFRDLSCLVDVGKVFGEGLVDGARLDELVEVTCNDDVGKRVLEENVFDETLCAMHQ